jgi:hypothetical protein
MGASFSHPEARMDHGMSRGMRSIMLRNDAYPICDDEEVTARRYPPLTMEASALRGALDIMQDAIVHVSEHRHAAGDHPTCPTCDHGA